MWRWQLSCFKNDIMKDVIFVVRQMVIPSNFGHSFIHCCEGKEKAELVKMC
jgi:hypothetical protein